MLLINTKRSCERVMQNHLFHWVFFFLLLLLMVSRNHAELVRVL
jgi:hypothetical protein